MAVDAGQIANLLAIAKYGSFTRAAAEKGMSQPALSNSIALLEQRLGVQVLDRSRRGSTLTPYGEILVRRAEGVFSLLSDAETEVRHFANGVGGPLRIGATPSVLANLVPRALGRVVEGTGPVDIEIVDDLDDALVPMLRSGRIDVIVGPVAEMFHGESDVVEEILFQDPFAIAAGPRSPFHGRGSLTLAELAEARWILPRQGSTYRRHVESMFMTRSVPWPRDCILANSLALLESLVRATDRITLVSRVQIAAGDPGFAVIPLEGAGHRTIGFKLRAGAKPTGLVTQFCDALREAAATCDRQPITLAPASGSSSKPAAAESAA